MITVETNSRDCSQYAAFTSIDRCCFVLIQTKFVMSISGVCYEYLSPFCVLST